MRTCLLLGERLAGAGVAGEILESLVGVLPRKYLVGEFGRQFVLVNLVADSNGAVVVGR